MKRGVQVLEFELKQFIPNIAAEDIKNLTFAASTREIVSSSGHSDKTAKIAIDHFDRQINGEYHALRTLIGNMQVEIKRIEYYLSLLPKKEAAVIKMFYFENLTWDQIAKRTFWAPRSLQRYKARGIEELVKLYSMLEMLDAQNLEILARVCFISYIHEDRYMECLKQCREVRNPSVKAFLYLISGCNELWKIGAENLMDIETGVTIKLDIGKAPLSEGARMLLQLAYHLAEGFDGDAVHVLQCFFPKLEYVYLELAIKGLKMVLMPEIGA
jgi:predicted DNA-binding protein YlxM (UPF0122 family)